MIPEQTVAIIAVSCIIIGFIIGGGIGWSAGIKRGMQIRQHNEPVQLKNMRTIYGKDFKNSSVMYNAIASRLKKEGEVVVVTNKPDELIKRLPLKLEAGRAVEHENLNGDTYKLKICTIGT